MNLCSDDHEEICFESRKCPMCELKMSFKEENDELQAEIDDLKKQLSES